MKAPRVRRVEAPKAPQVRKVAEKKAPQVCRVAAMGEVWGVNRGLISFHVWRNRTDNGV